MADTEKTYEFKLELTAAEGESFNGALNALGLYLEKGRHMRGSAAEEAELENKIVNLVSLSKKFSKIYHDNGLCQDPLCGNSQAAKQIGVLREKYDKGDSV